MRGVPRQDGKPRFVSAFCQSNCGDVSPNVLGAFCIDTGLPCDFNHSTCGGKNELCYGKGPGYLFIAILHALFFSLANLHMFFRLLNVYLVVTNMWQLP